MRIWLIRTLKVIRQEIDCIIIVLKIQVQEFTWMIPLSSQIDKYKRIVKKKEKPRKPCDITSINP